MTSSYKVFGIILAIEKLWELFIFVIVFLGTLNYAYFNMLALTILYWVGLFVNIGLYVWSRFDGSISEQSENKRRSISGYLYATITEHLVGAIITLIWVVRYYGTSPLDFFANIEPFHEMRQIFFVQFMFSILVFVVMVYSHTDLFSTYKMLDVPLKAPLRKNALPSYRVKK